MAELKMLAIDLGASSGRGIVGRYDGKKLTLEENHRFPNEPVLNCGSFNWDILRIAHEIKNSIRKCALSDDKDIRTIAIDTWGVEYGLLDKNGSLLKNPVHYRDDRTLGIIDYTRNILTDAEIYNATGAQFKEYNTLYQLIAEKRDNEKIIDAAETMLFTPDLLNYFLTGEKHTEFTIASTGMLLDAKTRDWAYDLIDKAGLPRRLFTKVYDPGEKVGTLLPSVLEEVGDIKAEVIHTAAHDTASAVIAVPAKGENFVYISSGTWSLMGTEIEKPIIDDRAYNYNFTNEGSIGGKTRFLQNIMGLWLEQESKRQWAREGEIVTFDQLSDAAVASKPLACFIDPDDMLFSPPGNLPRRIQEFCAKTGQYVPQTKGEIVRCIFDSLAMRYRLSCDMIDEQVGKRTEFVNIVGGGTKEAPLCQFTANACGRPVYAGPVEATAIGNICTQAIAAGELKDVNEAREVVRNSFEVKTYEPKDTDMWEEGYERFKKIRTTAK